MPTFSIWAEHVRMYLEYLSGVNEAELLLRCREGFRDGGLEILDLGPLPRLNRLLLLRGLHVYLDRRALKRKLEFEKNPPWYT